ncbi:YjgN family protein [Aerolutibacter daejeonensis]|uniref:YjgN family protein n=1 Tax=Aerolutibacter daejeonensis TaxID=346181 RepID=UPI000690EF54|nr:YjgN family protein [Lysobacter daejeonensis]
MLDAIPAAPAGDFFAPSEAPATQHHTAQFSGRAGEYFGIWFVNLLLSIITLGIYSAWAKVRTERYFYANTSLAGATFEYLASPIAILKGRLIAYAVVIALGLSSRFSPGLYLLLIVGVGAMMPALITWSLRFRARNSAWRGLTFRFDNGAPEAYGPFMLWAWISGLTASLLYPAMKRRQHEFVVEGHRYGVKRFRFLGTTGQYYGPYLVVAGTMVGGLILLGVVTAMLSDSGLVGKQALGAGMAFGLLAFYLVFFALIIMMRVRYTNLMWNYTRLGEHRFASTLRVRDLLWIYASNLVAVLFTVGLAAPWAMVRLARYRAEHFTLIASGELDEFVAASESRAGAAGAELVDALDAGMDFGL